VTVLSLRDAQGQKQDEFQKFSACSGASIPETPPGGLFQVKIGCARPYLDLKTQA
jgi:hypothetical protein